MIALIQSAGGNFAPRSGQNRRRVRLFPIWLMPMIVWLGAVSAAVSVRGQGSTQPVVLRTGGGIPLLSTNLSLTIPAVIPDPRLQFDFGFATDEVFGPGQFFDSFTVTLQDTGGLQSVVVLVADISGLVIAPPTPGTIPLDPTSVTNTAIPFPSLEPTLATRMAFTIVLPLPAPLAQLPQLNVYFDLADNLDTIQSLGWFNSVMIIVPEPAAGSLITLGGLIFVAIRRCNRRSTSIHQRDTREFFSH